jgi:hypothetical protein
MGTAMNNRDKTRQDNLITLLRELAWEGVETLQSQAHLLGTPAKTLHAAIMGTAMSNAMARELEWAAHKPKLWMDASQEASSLER